MFSHKMDVQDGILLVGLLQDILEDKDLTAVPLPPRNLFLRFSILLMKIFPCRTVCILLMRILLSTLLAGGSKVSPFQLVHSCKLPSLEILEINPFVHSLNTFFSFHVVKGGFQFFVRLVKDCLEHLAWYLKERKYNTDIEKRAKPG